MKISDLEKQKQHWLSAQQQYQGIQNALGNQQMLAQQMQNQQDATRALYLNYQQANSPEAIRMNQEAAREIAAPNELAAMGRYWRRNKPSFWRWLVA